MSCGTNRRSHIHVPCDVAQGGCCHGAPFENAVLCPIFYKKVTLGQVKDEHLLPMSSCTIVGFFGLQNGHLQSTEVKKPDGGSYKLWHTYYDTCVICSSKWSMPAEVRLYSSAKAPILRDDTTAFVVAKLNVPTGDATDVLLEAWHIAPVPGDPEDRDYDARLIDFEMPLVFALGIVGTGHESPAGGVQTFPVTVTDFVRGGMMETVLSYVVDVGKVFGCMTLILFVLQLSN